jgi:hypothetical protein
MGKDKVVKGKVADDIKKAEKLAQTAAKPQEKAKKGGPKK